MKVEWSGGETGPEASPVLFLLFGLYLGEEDMQFWVERNENKWSVWRGRGKICPVVPLFRSGGEHRENQQKKIQNIVPLQSPQHTLLFKYIKGLA